jgi:hypothetical protein
MEGFWVRPHSPSRTTVLRPVSSRYVSVLPQVTTTRNTRTATSLVCLSDLQSKFNRFLRFLSWACLGKRSFRSRKLKVNVESTAVYFVLEPGPCVRCPETAGAKRLSFLYLFIIYYYLLYILLFISFLRNLSFETKKGSLVTIRGLPRQARDTKFEPKRPFRFGLCRFVSFRVTFRSFRARVVLVSCPFRLVWRRLGLLALR